MGRFCFHLFTIFKTYRSSKLARWILGPTVSAYGWLCHARSIGYTGRLFNVNMYANRCMVYLLWQEIKNRVYFVC